MRPPAPEQLATLLHTLEATYGRPGTELHHRNPYELLVAVVLSAQCTDARVNLTTPALFARYPTPEALAQATEADLLPLVKSISYPNNKTRHLLGLARQLVAAHGGQIPTTREALEALPGVGRKTANVMLSVAFDQAALAVDTHVYRVAHRLGLAHGKTPRAVEDQLMQLLPPDTVAVAHHWLILHGRYVCKSRTPQCHPCPLLPLCPHGQALARGETPPDVKLSVNRTKKGNPL